MIIINLNTFIIDLMKHSNCKYCILKISLLVDYHNKDIPVVLNIFMLISNVVSNGKFFLVV